MLRQVAIERWSESGALRGAVARGYALLRERDPGRLCGLIAADTEALLGASLVRVFAATDEGFVPPEGDGALPAAAVALEEALLPRALAASRSLLSSHPALDRDLEPLADACRAAGVTVHLLLLRWEQTTIGVYAAHWVGRERPGFERRASFYYYWDIAGLALAAAQERRNTEGELSALRHAAHRDRLTGLPNTLALEAELHRHTDGPLGVLALDFDGLREANTTLGYVEGGDALIARVGAALATLTRPGELAARLHTAGDEFVVLLPDADEPAAHARAHEIETALDRLDLPPELQVVYRGASVGAAARQPAETTGQTLGRAIEAMRQRKRERGR